MRNKILNGVLILLLGVSGVLYAGEMQINVDKAVAKMTKELNLTELQAESVKTILTDYFTKRQEIMGDDDAQGVTLSKARQKELLMALKEEENEKFAQVLTPEQMNKLHQKDQMRQLLNKDKIDFQDYLWDSSAGQPGSSFQF